MFGLMPNGELRQANLKMLFQKAKQYESSNFKGLYNFINFIDRLKLSSGDLGSAKLIGENDNVIRIMSIHKSKGLEFPVVFLPGMEDGLFPGWRAYEKPDGLEEERRLCYVGMTRAKEVLNVSYVKTKNGKETSPSRFVDELLE